MGSARVYTIPSGDSFVDSLAAGLLSRFGADADALSKVRILLPTRRACRALADAFLRQVSGAALIPPEMTPIGDIDETDLAFGIDAGGLSPGGLDIPPAIPEIRRRLLLAKLILGQRRAIDGAAIRPEQAVRLAEELGRFLDQVHTERVSFDGLADIVPEEFAEHWQITLEFLSILTDAWPGILADEGCIDPADRRNRLIDAQIARWRENPPTGTVIVAGSTGSLPATAELIAAVAAMPNGAVVLPGLDTTLDSASRDAIGATHPQFAMVRLIQKLGVNMAEVASWPAGSPPPPEARPPPRAALLTLVMRPASIAPADIAAEMVADAVTDVRRVDAATAHEEAVVIALALREALEVPEKTAALVTPERGLARRVAAELQRWDILIDDSAGQPLADTTPGTFLRLTAALVSERAAPVPLLACLKHPLAAGGLTPGEFRARVRALELAVLRGPSPGPGFDGLVQALGQKDEWADLVSWVSGIAEVAAPLEAELVKPGAALADIIEAHVAFAEALARTDTHAGAAMLWRGDAGHEAARFVRELHGASLGFVADGAGTYSALMTEMMRGRAVRPVYGRHPRLHIWGPLEARLQQVDLLILGGLNEGTWPPEPPLDPWMSRPMRQRFGLSPPERRVGLSAHDFAQAFSAPRVMLTRATRIEGTPTVPSRWLLRLDNVLEQTESPAALRRDTARWSRWQAALDAPALPILIRAPGPCPPLAARPRRLSVTQIETLIRDPYAIYARHVLKLRPLDPIDADPAASDRGTIIHNALEKFLDAYPDTMPDDAVARLIDIGEKSFGATLNMPGVRAFWWPRFVQVASWFVALERGRRTSLRTIHNEITGTATIDLPGGPFTLTGKADRIDVRADGAMEIIDYKTGAPPTAKHVEQGYSPQLVLEAMIAADGGFPDIEPAVPADLSYWRLTGGDPAGEIYPAGDDVAAMVADVRAGLSQLIARYDDESTPYLSHPDPGHPPPRSDYDHLARVKEWLSQADGESS